MLPGEQVYFCTLHFSELLVKYTHSNYTTHIPVPVEKVEVEHNCTEYHAGLE